MAKKNKAVDEKELKARVEKVPYWYHKIELPGVTTPGWAPIDVEQYGVPLDLTGKRVLDVGGWDGFWTFEALKRGAKEAVCIDDFSDKLGTLTDEQRPKWETFDLCREALGYSEEVCKRIEISVYDITEENIGRFDVVFFFGTLYHLKYPMYGLDKLSAICDGRIYVESAVCEDYSVYRGGFNKGYSDSVVAEFYPDAQYGDNEGNWFAPSLNCLAAFVSAAGFHNMEVWKLIPSPASLAECRGFCCASKDPDDVSARGKLIHNVNIVGTRTPKLKTGMAMSVPRLGFTDNDACIHRAMASLRMPLYKEQGVFWGQCLERALEHFLDEGMDAIITVDYDTIFEPEDVLELIRLMETDPDIDALVSVQQGRGFKFPLLTMRHPSGRAIETCRPEMFVGDTTKIATGHFGLTIIRASAILDLPHPWFYEKPDRHGRWGAGRIDADISFWLLMEKHNKRVCLANRVPIGHGTGDVIIWPSETFGPLYQASAAYRTDGKPKGIWK